MENKYYYMFLCVVAVSIASIFISLIIVNKQNPFENNSYVIVRKTQLTTGDEYIPPGLSIYSYKVSGSNELIEFMDSTNKYSIGDTIIGKSR